MQEEILQELVTTIPIFVIDTKIQIIISQIYSILLSALEKDNYDQDFKVIWYLAKKIYFLHFDTFLYKEVV